MKKLLVLMMSAVLLLASCAQSKQLKVNGQVKTYEPHGWADMNEMSDSVHYKVCVSNVVCSALLVETVVAPVVITGWFLWEPVETKAEWSKEHQ